MVGSDKPLKNISYVNIFEFSNEKNYNWKLEVFTGITCLILNFDK